MPELPEHDRQTDWQRKWLTDRHCVYQQRDLPDISKRINAAIFDVDQLIRLPNPQNIEALRAFRNVEKHLANVTGTSQEDTNTHDTAERISNLQIVTFFQWMVSLKCH